MNLDDITPQPWQDQARCIEVGDPELFFPPKGGNPREAVSVCRECPVQAECLDRALGLARVGIAVTGVWGGTSERQRKDLLTGAARYCRDCGTEVRPTERGRHPARCPDCAVRRHNASQTAHQQRRRTA